MESKGKFIVYAIIAILIFWWFYSLGGSDNSVSSFGSSSYDDIVNSGPYEDLEAELAFFRKS